MSRHYLQQWGHYKHQIDERIARPNFLENLAHSAGGIINLLNNINDTSLSDWSKGLTPSGKPLLTPEEQVKFKQALDPYVDIIRSDSVDFQQGGAEELGAAIEKRLTQNMAYMGQHNVVMHGGGLLDDIDKVMQQLAYLKRMKEEYDDKADIPIYAGVSLSVRTIITTIYVLLDTIRMLLTMGGFDQKSQILSLMVGIMDILDGEWKRSILSLIGYIGPNAFWVGQFIKIFLVLFHNVTPSLMYAGLSIGQTAMMYWAASLLQIFSPLPIRKQIMSLIDPINKQNKALYDVIEKNKDILGIPDFTKDNPDYSEYLNDNISWSTLYILIDYLKRPEYNDSLEVITFRANLKKELEVLNEKQRAIIKPLLQFVGFLPIPFDKKEPDGPHQSFVVNVINTMRQKVKKSSWTDEMTKTVTDAVDRAKEAVKARNEASEATNEVASEATNEVASKVPSEAGQNKSFFSKAMNAVKGLKPEPSKIQQAKDDLELKELQLRIKKINSEMALMNAAESAAKRPAKSNAASVAASNAASPATSNAASVATSPLAINAASPAESVTARAANGMSTGAPMPASIPVALNSTTRASTTPRLYSPQGSRQLPLVIGQGGGRSTRRTRRIRASKRSLRQRARE